LTGVSLVIIGSVFLALSGWVLSRYTSSRQIQ
jgi:hypothetical protein